MRSVLIKSRGLTITGHLYLPSGFRESEHYPAIAVVGSGGAHGRAAEYGLRLADQGFVTLVFEAIGQVAVEVSSGVDYLSTLSFVDMARVGVLGVCDAGTMALKAASSDYRIKAATTVDAEPADMAMNKATPFFMRKL